jgi:hypothetical protein
MIKNLMLFATVCLRTLLLQTLEARAQTSTEDTAAVQSRIDAEDFAVGKAIGTRNLAVLEKLWSPAMVVNSPANQIVSRDQVIESTFHGGLYYTSPKGTMEYFTVTNGVAIKI